jgi:hypothetical protein
MGVGTTLNRAGMISYREDFQRSVSLQVHLNLDTLIERRGVIAESNLLK